MRTDPKYAAEMIQREVVRLRKLSISPGEEGRAEEYNELADALCLALDYLPKAREATTITLKGIPPSMNRFAGRKNAWEYREEKEQWTRAVELASRASKERPKKPWGSSLVEITYFFPDHRRRDPDNYGGKFLLDGLTKAGVIVDDTFGNIRLLLSGEFNSGAPRTRITVTKREETPK